jgi:hypothetical protein
LSTSTARAYEGRWRRLINSAASSAGSIHDDATARSLGFAGGFVPGSTVGQAVLPAILHHYGPRWMEGGWYTLKFISPVYVHEDVHEVAQPRDGDSIDVGIVNRDGRVCCVGSAGLGVEYPWQNAASAGDDAVAGSADDDWSAESTFTATAEDVASILQASGDETSWYRGASPWGGPVIPPEYLMGVALRLTNFSARTPQGARLPGMWAEHALTLSRPLALDEAYRMVERLAESGRSGRTYFVAWEFAVTDADGNELARGRHKVKWFAEQQHQSAV